MDPKDLAAAFRLLGCVVDLKKTRAKLLRGGYSKEQSGGGGAAGVTTLALALPEVRARPGRAK